MTPAVHSRLQRLPRKSTIHSLGSGNLWTSTQAQPQIEYPSTGQSKARPHCPRTQASGLLAGDVTGHMCETHVRSGLGATGQEQEDVLGPISPAPPDCTCRPEAHMVGSSVRPPGGQAHLREAHVCWAPAFGSSEGPRLPRGSAHQSPAHRDPPCPWSPAHRGGPASISPLKEPSPQVSLPCWQVELTAPVPMSPELQDKEFTPYYGLRGRRCQAQPWPASQKVINYGSCLFGCFPSKNISGSASVLSEEGLHSPHS